MPTRRAPDTEHRGEPRLPVDRDDPPPPAAPARNRPMGWPPGTTIRVPDDAYRFGEGPLTLRIAEVLSVGPFEGRLWAEVRGHQVDSDGTVHPRERFASIRVDRARVVATAAAGAAASGNAASGTGTCRSAACRADASEVGAARVGAARVGADLAGAEDPAGAAGPVAR
ncbi:hypothetical protein AB0883_24735 [Micromonospora sp. NPDC047812]|uniref:hypothetical protein n=1 Tax=Micromonospora sp. NPDC047812 TaxID=3155742 RepID=UPI003456D362